MSSEKMKDNQEREQKALELFQGDNIDYRVSLNSNWDEVKYECNFDENMTLKEKTRIENLLKCHPWKLEDILQNHADIEMYLIRLRNRISYGTTDCMFAFRANRELFQALYDTIGDRLATEELIERRAKVKSFSNCKSVSSTGNGKDMIC